MAVEQPPPISNGHQYGLVSLLYQIVVGRTMSEMRAQDNTVEFSEDSITPITTEWGRDSENTPVFAVVSAVADAEEVDPVELPPLYEAIEPEALNDLFTSRSESSVGKVTFQYAGYDVVVRGTGEVEVQSIHQS